MCLELQFVNGSTINTVYFILENDNASYPLGNISYNNELTFTKCFSDIPANEWTVYTCYEAFSNGCANQSVAAIISNIMILSCDTSRNAKSISSYSDNTGDLSTSTGT